MTTPAMLMDCDGFANALADYLEGDATDAVRLAVESHAAQCAACALLLADLNGIRAEASSLPQLVPSRDLWSGIAERIDAPVIPMGVSRPAGVIRRTWMRPAVAAAALVAVTAGLTYVVTRASLSSPSSQVASVGDGPARSEGPALPVVASEPTAEFVSTATESPAPVATAPAPAARQGGTRQGAVTLASRALDSGEPVLEKEIVSLRKIVSERRDQLDPKTIAVLEQSVAVIDAAIAQSRAALAKDPASGFLVTQLNRSLEKKVELLRTATSLPAGT